MIIFLYLLQDPFIEDNDDDAYFKVWPLLFKFLYHPSMKQFNIPDFKSILIDRMYMEMEDHLVSHRGKILICI